MIDLSVVINNCEQANPCLNGGTCVPLPNSYTCTCADGFSGQVCQDATGKRMRDTMMVKYQLWLITAKGAL